MGGETCELILSPRNVAMAAYDRFAPSVTPVAVGGGRLGDGFGN